MEVTRGGYPLLNELQLGEDRIIADLSANITSHSSEYAQKDALISSTLSNSNGCLSDDIPQLDSIKDFQSQDLIITADDCGVTTGNSDALFLKHAPFCNYQLVHVIQKVKRGIDCESSFFERFHILKNFSNWNILVSSVAKGMLTNLYDGFKSKKSLAYLFLGPSGAGKSHALFVVALFFCSQIDHNVRVFYIPDCLMWAKSRDPIEFFLNELLFSLSTDDFVNELMHFLLNLNECRRFDFLFSELSDWAQNRGLQILFVFDQVLFFRHLADCF